MGAATIGRLLASVLLCLSPATAQVELPPGEQVPQNVKGDFFGKRVEGEIFDPSANVQLKGNTDPAKRVPPPQLQATPSPSPEPQASEEALPPQEENDAGSALKNKVLERATQDRGMLEILNRSRQIKEQIGVSDQGETVAPTRDFLREKLQGVRESLEQDPSKKKTNQIAFNGPDIGLERGSENDLQPPAVLSLIVSGADAEHLNKHTSKLAWMASHRNVKVGNVMIVGMSGVGGGLGQAAGGGRRRFIPSSNWLSKQYTRLAEAGLESYEMVLTERLFSRLDIHNSPTWVVRHLGRDYVFEGFQDPTHFFTKDGTFLRADY